MSDTPIIDAAISAAKPVAPNGAAAIVLAALRAALPWDLPAERLEAMARAMAPPTLDRELCDLKAEVASLIREGALAAYRADPIMRELYPEQFR